MIYYTILHNIAIYFITYERYMAWHLSQPHTVLLYSPRQAANNMLLSRWHSIYWAFMFYYYKHIYVRNKKLLKGVGVGCDTPSQDGVVRIISHMCLWHIFWVTMRNLELFIYDVCAEVNILLPACIRKYNISINMKLIQVVIFENVFIHFDYYVTQKS